MKKIIHILLAVMCIVILGMECNISNSQVENLNPKKKKLSKEQRVEGRAEFEWLRQHDPKTKTIPSERLAFAKEYADELRQQKATTIGLPWQERGPNNVGGRTRTILDLGGNVILAGSVGGGLWKSTNNGASWSVVDDYFSNLAVTCIAQDPNNSQTIYFGTGEGFGNHDAIQGEGIWKSVDGGNSWTHLMSTFNSQFRYVNRISVTDQGSIIAATRGAFSSNGGIMRSSDGGNTFTKEKSGVAYDVKLAADGDLFAGFGNSDGIYRSQDDGLNWTLVYSSAANEDRIELAIAPSNHNVVYAIFENTTVTQTGNPPITVYGVPQIRKSNTGGNTWGDLNEPVYSCGNSVADWTRGQDWYDIAIGVHPTNHNHVMIGGIDLFKTIDGGVTWVRRSQWTNCGTSLPIVHSDQHAIHFAGGNKVWIGNDGGIYLSTDAGISFAEKNNGYIVTQYFAADIHPTLGSNNMLAGSQDNGTHKFSTAGINGENEVTGGDGAFCHIDQNNGNLQISSYVNNNYRVTNNNWASYVERNVSETTGLFINPTDYDDVANVLYCSNQPNNYLRWNDPASLGNSFSTVAVSNMSGSIITAIRQSPNVANRIYLGLSNGNILRVDNAHTGTSKTGVLIFNPPFTPWTSCIDIEDGDEDHIVVTYSQYGVNSIYESTNATSSGATFQSIEGNLPDMPVNWAMINPNNSDQAYIATEIGIWSTDDLNGTSTQWQPSNTGLGNVRCDMIKYRASGLDAVVATHGRGVYTADLNGCVQASAGGLPEYRDEFAVHFDIEGDGNGVHDYPNHVGDFNGDGNDDILFLAQLASPNDLQLRTKLSQGNGQYSAVNDTEGDGTGVHTLPSHVGDFNGDGNDDIVFFVQYANPTGLQTRTKFSNGDGTFTGVNYLDGSGGSIHDYPAKIGDVDNDGDDDIVFIWEHATGNNLEIRTLLSNGDGTYTRVNESQADGNGIFNIPHLAGDINGDGQMDLVFFVQYANPTGLQVRTKISNGDGTYTAALFAQGSGAAAHDHPKHIGDVDGDGNDDVLFMWQGTGSTGLQFRTLFSVGDGTYTVVSDAQGDGSGVHTYPSHQGDFNSDGLMDVLFLGPDWVACGSNARIKYSMGNGEFCGSWEYLVDGNGVFTNPALVGDFVGDGRTDIAFVGQDWAGPGTLLNIRTKSKTTQASKCMGNFCTLPIALNVGSTCNSATFSNATIAASSGSPAFSCGSTGSTIDVWFEVIVPASGNVTIETTQTSGGLTDMVMQVLAGSCGSLTEVACDDDSGAANHALISLTGRTPNERLYVRVVDLNSDQFGDFGICAFDTTNPNCPPNYSGPNQLTGTQSSIMDFETDGVLESNQIIDSDVDYDSGTHIDLLAGFEVKIGKLFHAFIDGCGNLFRDEEEDSSKKNKSK